MKPLFDLSMFTPDNPIDLSSSDLLHLFHKFNIDLSSLEKVGRNTYFISSPNHRFVLKTSLKSLQVRSIATALDFFKKFYDDVFDVPVVVDIVDSPYPNGMVLMSYVSGLPIGSDDYSFVFQTLTNNHPVYTFDLSIPSLIARDLDSRNHFFSGMSTQIMHMLTAKSIYSPLLSFFFRWSS